MKDTTDGSLRHSAAQRSFLYVMDNTDIEATPRYQSTPSQDIYLSNGRLKSTVERVSQFNDTSILDLLDTGEGFYKLVHSIGVSVNADVQADSPISFTVQVLGPDKQYESGKTFSMPCHADGTESVLTIADLAWPAESSEIGQFAIVFDKPNILGRATIKLYLQDDFAVPPIAEEPPVDFSSQAYQKMIEQSFVSLGNPYRLQAAIARARKGEDVTVAYIGGSITQGASAKPIHKNCYAHQSFLRFQKMFGKNGGGNVHFIKGGVGGTPSEFGMIRYERDILRNGEVQPDVIVVEFAVNDDSDETKGIAYESLCLDLLRQPNHPAVILLFSVFYNDWNLQDRLMPVGEQYGLPMVSIKNAVVEQFKRSKAEGNVISKKQYFYDIYHPTTEGHRIMAESLAYLFEQADKAPAAGADSSLDKPPVIGNQFAGIRLLDRKTPAACAEIHCGSFTGTDSELQMVEMDDNPVPTPQLPYNWMHDPASGSAAFTLKITSRNLLVVFKDFGSSAFGKAEVLLDGQQIKTLDPNIAGWTHCNTVLLYDEPLAAAHKVEIRMAEGDENKQFTILAFGYTE